MRHFILTLAVILSRLLIYSQNENGHVVVRIEDDYNSKAVRVTLDLTKTEINLRIYDVTFSIAYFNKFHRKIDSANLTFDCKGQTRFEPPGTYQQFYPYRSPQTRSAKGMSWNARADVRGSYASGDSLRSRTFQGICFNNDEGSDYADSRMTLGTVQLSFESGKPLIESVPLSTALSRFSYLSRVGGIAFEKIASPDNDLDVKNLELEYDSAAPDGNRCFVILNNKRVKVPLYDWQLAPIARYANSPNTACFTLFGQLNNNEMRDSLVTSGSRVLNYHPAFENTLLGLRLFQLDILIVYPSLSIYLPKVRDHYLLGMGEAYPNIRRNLQSYSIFDSVRESYMIRDREYYDSYIICDTNSDIRFGITGNKFHISGQPFYYFVHFGSGFRQEDSVFYCKRLSMHLSKRLEFFKNINPTVWDAGVKTLRFAAFFRFCKKYFPEPWGKFISRINTVRIEPEVQTPTVLHLSGPREF